MTSIDFTTRVLTLALLAFVVAVLAAGVLVGSNLGDALSHVVTVTR
jgi:hypothetical protein